MYTRGGRARTAAMAVPMAPTEPIEVDRWYADRIASHYSNPGPLADELRRIVLAAILTGRNAERDAARAQRDASKVEHDAMIVAYQEQMIASEIERKRLVAEIADLRWRYGYSEPKGKV